MVITSVTNNTIKYLTKLKQRKFRENEGKFLVEGEHLVEEAKKNNLLEKVIKLENSQFYFDIDSITVSKEVMKKLSDLDTPPNIIGLCKMKEEKKFNDKIVILDGIQDPGNLGTIIRSCVAFGVDTIILSLNTVDLYNPKVVRATQGMLFKVNVIRKDLMDIIKEIKNNNIPVYTTNVENGENIKDVDETGKYALIVGNEGQGVSGEVSNLADKRIYIPMKKEVESLNVAVATSILLYELDGKNG